MESMEWKFVGSGRYNKLGDVKTKGMTVTTLQRITKAQ